MEIMNDNKVVIDIYKYDEIISQLTFMRNENNNLLHDNTILRDLLREKDNIIQMLSNLITKGGDNND